MKIDLKKIAEGLGAVATSLTAGNKEETLAKLAEVTGEVEAAQAAGEDPTPTGEGETKVEEQIKNAVEVELKKYADLYVSASDFKALVESIKQVTDKLGTVENLAKTATDTLATLTKTPGDTKQDVVDIKNTASSPLEGLASRL